MNESLNTSAELESSPESKLQLSEQNMLELRRRLSFVLFLTVLNVLLFLCMLHHLFL
jgi:hypothetical protein